MTTPKRICVLGTFANVPYAGMAWMHCQFLVGLARLGHDVCYVESTTAWPYHPLKMTTTDDPSYSLAYLDRVLRSFGFDGRWAYCAAYADGRWYGPLASQAVEQLRSADAVLNITGSTTPEELNVPCRLVYIGTDPVLQELKIACGDAALRQRVAAHVAHFTYGENIGTSACAVPPLPFKTHAMRQPIVVDLWRGGPTTNPAFTTVTNWEVKGYDVEFQGERYTWSKHHEYLKIIDLPRKTSVSLELAMGLSGVSDDVRALLNTNGWLTVDAYQMSLDPWSYHDYVRSSTAELSVAKDMVARTKCGWFSERSACYLAAGRPVITQDTGFGAVLPTGEGLFAFNSIDEILAAIEAIKSDYPRHSRAARAIAEEYFQAEKVLAKLLGDLGL
jgi:hypothetical protein